MARDDFHPGDVAPSSGRYAELNIFGRRTGRTVDIRQGDEFPAAPRGFSWSLLADPSLAIAIF